MCSDSKKLPKLNLITMLIPNMPALNMLLFHIKNQIGRQFTKLFPIWSFRNLEKSLEFMPELKMLNVLSMPVPKTPALNMLLFHIKNQIDTQLKWPKLNLISMPAPNIPALNMLLFHIKNQIDPINLPKFFQCDFSKSRKISRIHHIHMLFLTFNHTVDTLSQHIFNPKIEIS